MFSSLISPLRRPAVWALAYLSLVATQVFAAPSSVNFGNVPVGATSATQKVDVTFTAPGTIEEIRTVLLGATNLDYRREGGTCRRGASYAAGQSCTVGVAFAPLLPGSRNGAVVVTNASGATITTAYLTGIGQGPLPTFPTGSPAPVVNDIGSTGFAADGRGFIYYAVTGDPTIIYRLAPNGAREKFATMPSEYANISVQTVDGAGNLFLTTTTPQILKVDPSGVLSVLATIPYGPVTPAPRLDPIIVDGSGNVFVGGGQLSNGVVYKVTPAGVVSTAYTISSAYTFNFVASLALDSKGSLFMESYGDIYSTLHSLLFTAQANGLAADASDTLLIGQYQTDTGIGSYPPCPIPSLPAGCGTGVPPVLQLSFNEPKLDAQGNLYVVAPNGSAQTLYKLNRINPQGVTFASQGSQASNGSFAMTNSGNAPLDLSNVQATLSGANPQLFAIDRNTCSGMLLPASTCTVSMTFTPSGAYTQFEASASLLIDGLPSGEKIVPLQGYPNQ